METPYLLVFKDDVTELDRILLGCALFLAGCGVLCVFSAGAGRMGRRPLRADHRAGLMHRLNADDLPVRAGEDVLLSIYHLKPKKVAKTRGIIATASIILFFISIYIWAF